MGKYGTVINLGWGSAPNEGIIYQKITELIGDSNLRKRISKSGQQLVDGKGCLRIVKIIDGNTGEY